MPEKSGGPAVAVIAGTPYDSGLGAELLRAAGLPAQPYAMATSPDEQDALQYQDPAGRAGEPGPRALRDDRHPVGRGDPDDRGDLGGVLRSDHGQRCARCAQVGLVAAMRGEEIRVGRHPIRGQDRQQILDS